MTLGGSMTRLKANLAMSLDGYIAGPDQGAEHPLGKGGMRSKILAAELAASAGIPTVIAAGAGATAGASREQHRER